VAQTRYPPELHFLADLGIDLDASDSGQTVARMPVTPEVLGSDGGVLAGVLATLVDVVGGSIAARALHPDWMATADMSLQVMRPAVGPVVEARGTIQRQGRTTLIIEVSVFDLPESSSPVAWSILSFAVLPRAEDSPAAAIEPGFSSRLDFGPGGFDRHVLDALSIADGDDPGTVVMPVGAYVRNTIGAVQGGVVALLADTAGARAVSSALGAGSTAVAVDLQITYLATGRVGPMVTRVGPVSVAPASGSGQVVVELVDSGAGDRLTAVVTVGALAS
jgi:uncharacterized protein (TIGR00369 family)